MRQDLENVNYEELDNADKIEFGTILQGNFSILILQLFAGKEILLANILTNANTLRLADRNDLVLRLAQFSQELIRVALTDRQKDEVRAQLVERAIKIAAQNASEEAKNDVPAEEGESEQPIVDAPEKNN